MKKHLRKIFTLLLIVSLMIPSIPAKAAVTPKLNVTKKTIAGINKKYTLKLTADKKNLKTTWSSSKPSVATVTSKGVITSKKAGTTVITCTLKYPKKTAKKLKCTVKVTVPARAVSITNAVEDEMYGAHKLEVGQTFKFKTSLVSSAAKMKSTDKVYFTVSKGSDKISVTSAGTVKALKPGRATLKVCAGASKTVALKSTNRIIDTIDIYVVNPSVEVKAVNLASAKELDIIFSTAMNSSTLFNSSNTLTNNVSINALSDAKNPGALKATLSDDKKTLKITAENIFDGNYELKLTSNITSETGVPLKDNYIQTVSLKDTLPPYFLSYSNDDTGYTAYINFNEPIELNKLTVTNGKRRDGKTFYSQYIVNEAKNYKLSKDKKSLSIDLSSMSSSDLNQEIQVELAGLTDLAGNVPNPYPMVVYFRTNTVQTSQAKCLSLVRRGNSLVATFDKSIQLAGYVYVNGTTLSGEVNESNKKEVIYYLSNSALRALNTTQSVTLSSYSAYNTGGNIASNSSFSVSFGASNIAPAITSSKLATAEKDGSKQTNLILTFNENVTLLSTKGILKAQKNVGGLIDGTTEYSYTASVEGNEVTFVLNGNFQNSAIFTFSIPAGIVRNYYYCDNNAQKVTVTKTADMSSELPGPASIQTNNDENAVYITFNNTVDYSSAANLSNYSISGLIISSVEIINNQIDAPAIIKLNLASNSKLQAIPYQVSISGIKGYQDSYSIMKPYKEMITLIDNKIFESSSCYAFSNNKTLTLSFSQNVSSKSNVDFVFTKGSTTLTVQKKEVNGNTITFTFTNDLKSNENILVTPKTTNEIYNTSNAQWLNIPFTVTVQ